MKNNLTILESLVYVYWSFFDLPKYTTFHTLLSLGYNPREAYQEAKLE